MQSDQLAGQETLELIRRTIGDPLGPGEIGALLARAGVGKTACLTHIALEHLLRGEPVLHVCVDGVAEKIKIWYQELMKQVAYPSSRDELSLLQRKVESIRFILAYLHHTFSFEKLEQSFRNLSEQAKFVPKVMILDGLDLEANTRSTLESFKDFAARHQVCGWMSIRTHQHIATVNEKGIPYPCHESDDLLEAIMLLEPAQNAIRVHLLKHRGHYRSGVSEVFLNPQTYLLMKAS